MTVAVVGVLVVMIVILVVVKVASVRFLVGTNVPTRAVEVVILIVEMVALVDV